MTGAHKGLAARYYSCCVKCGREGRIKYMASVYIKAPASQAAPKLLFHLCQECTAPFLDDMEVAMPE